MTILAEISIPETVDQWCPRGPSSRVPLAEIERLLAGGYEPFPLPAGEKFPPPKGVTGAGAQPLPLDALRRLHAAGRFQNLGMRIPAGAVGIDVDYHSERDRWPVALLLDRAAPTHVIRNRAGDDVSGTYLWRAEPPAGRRYRSSVGMIDLIHSGHRYQVMPPSIHPSGREYYCEDPWGRHRPVPPISELPWLDAEVLEMLTVEIERPVERGAIQWHGHSDALAGNTTICAGMAAALGGLRDADRGSNHDHYRTLVGRVFRAHCRGHRGRDRAVELLRLSWLATVSNGQRRIREFDSLVDFMAKAVGDAAESACHCGPGIEP